MNIVKVSFVTALMLVSSGSAAFAGGDWDDQGSMKDSYVEAGDTHRGWYWRGDIGFGWNQDPDTTDSNKAKFILDDADENWSIGGGIGYHLMRGLRIDATLDHRMDTDIFSQLDSGTVPDNQFTGELDSTVGLINIYYDLDMGHRITPYIGAGIGFAYHDMDGDDANDSDTEFAWALMAGVAVDLRTNWKLDVGYRYLNMGEGSFDDSKTPGRKFIFDDLNSHELRIGVRYDFSCWRDCTPSYTSMK